jgi:hypothetical protein
MIIPKHEVHLFIKLWGLFLLGLLILGSALTINIIINSRRITNAQIKQLGSPQIIEQRYYTSLEKK